MRNPNPKIVRIIGLGHLECKKCGQRWSPNVKPDTGGKFYRGAWQCPNGCKK